MIVIASRRSSRFAEKIFDHDTHGAITTRTGQSVCWYIKHYDPLLCLIVFTWLPGGEN